MESYEKAYEAIKSAGEAGISPDALRKIVEIKPKASLNPTYNLIRAMLKYSDVKEKYPHFFKDKNIVKMVSAEEFAELTAGDGATKEKKWTDDPNQKRFALNKKIATHLTRLNKAKKTFVNDSTSEKKNLRYKIALAQYRLCEIEQIDFIKKLNKELKAAMNVAAYQDTDLNSMQAIAMKAEEEKAKAV
jgi:hypothetical protein